VAATGLTASGLGAAYLIAGNGPPTKVANAAADLPPWSWDIMNSGTQEPQNRRS